MCIILYVYTCGTLMSVYTGLLGYGAVWCSCAGIAIADDSEPPLFWVVL